MLRFAFFLLVCITLSFETQGYTHEYKTEHADAYVIPRKIASADNSFLHVSCARSQVPHEAECHATIEMPSGGRKHCPVKLVEPETREVVLTDHLAVKRFGEHKIVFEWFSRDQVHGYQYQYKKVSVIDMDSCSTVHLDFWIDRRDWPNHHVVVYKDSFDVYVTSKSVCGNHEHCIVRHNHEGQQIGAPIRYVSKYANVHCLPVSYHHPEKGAYFVGVEWQVPHGVLHGIHVTHDGTEHDLFAVPIHDASSLKHVVASNEHGHFGLCHYEEPAETKLHCVQYDSEGHQRMDATIELQHGHRVIGAYNGHEGGFVIVYRGCGGTPECTSVHVMFVDVQGHVVKHQEIQGVEYPCRSPSRELVVDHAIVGQKHCFYFACEHEVHAGSVGYKFTNVCMDKEALA